MPHDVKFFATPASFRKWLAANHEEAQELWVGFYKKGTGHPSITWPESVDEALCFGWIDGIRKTLDAESYVIRFTPRKPQSTWSAVNIKRVAELKRDGRMTPPGLAAFQRRTDDRSAIYAYEQRKTATFDKDAERQFRANKPAWEFFQSQPPGYRHLAAFFVINAKKEETRQKRLERLIADSAARRRIGVLARDEQPASGSSARRRTSSSSRR